MKGKFPVPSVPGTILKVLTLNTWQECGPWEQRWEIIFQGLETYQPDLVGFQEVFNPDWAEAVMKRSKFPHLVFSSDPSGLMILSKFPVCQWSSYTMKTKSLTENYKRYALFAELEVGKNRFAVFNTHLSWRLEEGKIREGQVDELLAFINDKAPSAETLVMGDFNSTCKTSEVRGMPDKGGFVDSFAALHPEAPGLTWDNRNPFAAGSSHPLPDRRIDYIFFRNASALLPGLVASDIVFDQPNREGVFASDHYGLLNTFKSKTGEL